MNRNRPSFPSATAGIEIVETDDGSRTLRFSDKPVTWHSESGALAESQLVYLENSDVAKRLVEGRATSVFEVGFGTGLNFWLTASLAMKHQTLLHYTSVEPDLISFATLSELEYYRLPTCNQAFHQFSNRIFEANHREVRSSFSSEGVSLELSGITLQSWLAESHKSFNAIYFDPFDPDEAPELWQPEIFANLFQKLTPGGRLVTYCVKSKIQRAISAAGFRVYKTRGPIKGKREVLVAERTSH